MYFQLLIRCIHKSYNASLSACLFFSGIIQCRWGITPMDMGMACPTWHIRLRVRLGTLEALLSSSLTHMLNSHPSNSPTTPSSRQYLPWPHTANYENAAPDSLALLPFTRLISNTSHSSFLFLTPDFLWAEIWKLEGPIGFVLNTHAHSPLKCREMLCSICELFDFPPYT